MATPRALARSRLGPLMTAIAKTPPLDQPMAPIRRAVDVGPGLQPAQRADRVVEALGARDIGTGPAAVADAARRPAIDDERHVAPCAKPLRPLARRVGHAVAAMHEHDRRIWSWPSGRASRPEMVSGLAGFAFGNDTADPAQPARTTEAAIAAQASRSMRRAYTGLRV